ncbi:MAG: hypothetical protein MUE58_11560 [Chitinophagaceae bacterium]|nr:hypothetical protein [Chitinophagaceae bacterium]
MKRRHFLRISLVGAAAAGLPIIGCDAFSGDKQHLSRPLLLSKFCDEAAIVEIGKAYQSLDPVARDAKSLTEALLADIYGNGRKPSAMDAIPIKKVNERIERDFRENLVVYPAGWVLSRTEARQCALYSLTA